MAESQSLFTTDTLLELHVPDFDRALEFYGLLGFSVVRTEPDYLVMQREQAVICFYGGTASVTQHSYFVKFSRATKRGYGVEVAIFVSDLQSLFDVVKDKVKVIDPPKERKWGAIDFRIEDPYGFYLRISERYDPLKIET